MHNKNKNVTIVALTFGSLKSKKLSDLHWDRSISDQAFYLLISEKDKQDDRLIYWSTKVQCVIVQDSAITFYLASLEDCYNIQVKNIVK